MKRIASILACFLAATCFAAGPIIDSYRFVVAGFSYSSVLFDGTNDYLTRGADVTGLSDGKRGLLSFWVKMDASSSDTGEYDIMCSAAGSTSKVRVYRGTTGDLSVISKNAAGTIIMDIDTGGVLILKSDGWVHLIVSWDLATAGNRRVYRNGTDVTRQWTFTNDTIDYTEGDWSIGAGTAGGNKIPALVCEFYFTTPAAYYDLTSAPNLAKFRTGSGIPADLGANGSTPTGTQPLIYFHTPVPSWEVNLGSGGGFTENGTLTSGGADIPIISGSTTSYANAGGTGNRQAIIVATASGGLVAGGTGDPELWINGNTTETGQYFNAVSLTGTQFLKWDFGSGKVIDEAKFYQSGASSHGSWKWQGSNDDSAWTDIGSTFTLGGGVATQTITAPSSNTTSYRYYRILGVSGTTSSVPWVHEFEFKISA